jgi:hypothetical protein
VLFKSLIDKEFFCANFARCRLLVAATANKSRIDRCDKLTTSVNLASLAPPIGIISTRSSAVLDLIEANGVRTVVVGDASRFARELMTLP